MNIAVIGACHVSGIAHALQHLIYGAKVHPVELVAVQRADRSEQVNELLDRCEFVLMQDIPHRIETLSTTRIRERFPGLRLLPTISFSGFHPDCIYLQHDQKVYRSPVGSYHSAIVAACFSLGFDADATRMFFNAFVFRELGYLDEFEKARMFMCSEMARYGFDCDEDWHGWMACGAFMHTINHPKVCVLASIAKFAAVSLGLVGAEVQTREVPYDWLASGTIWPVYPELARAISIQGSYLFKRDETPNLLGGKTLFIPLEDLIAESYEMYASYPSEVFSCDTVVRVRSALSTMANTWNFFPVHTLCVKEGQRVMSEITASRDPIVDNFWWHSIILDDGRVTPGIKNMAVMQTEAAAVFDPIDLVGKSVLDAGAWNGGFSIEAKRRGAKRVVALDHFIWNHPDFRGRRSFEFAVRACNVEVEAVEQDLDMPQLSLAHLGQFDVVLFLGVFYHLIDPIAALREISACVGDVLVLETHVEPTVDPRPSMMFYSHAELDNDPTNWWGPNRACVQQLLRLNGFNTVSVQPGALPRREIYHAYRRAQQP